MSEAAKKPYRKPRLCPLGDRDGRFSLEDLDWSSSKAPDEPGVCRCGESTYVQCSTGASTTGTCYRGHQAVDRCVAGQQVM